MDGACIDWIANGADVPRDALRGLLLGTLAGALMASGLSLDRLAAGQG